LSVNSAKGGTGTNKRIRKIWVAMSTPFQANFFAPLIEELQNDYDFFVTAREHDGISSILAAKRIPHVVVGKHGGRRLENKLEAYAHTIQQMLPLIEKEKPDLLLTERWPEAVRVAFGLNIPSWVIFYDEREKHVNQMVFPLASKIFVPRFYTFQELYQYGVTDLDKVVWFNGFHTGYLKDSLIQGDNPFKKLGVDSQVVFVRPEPEFASFFPNSLPILEKSVELITKQTNATVAVLPRTDKQRVHYSRVKNVIVMDASTHDSPVAHADVALGAAETMLMEAFVLGKPAVSAIYWEPSKPVQELHRHIAHSIEPIEIARHVDRYLNNDDEMKAFSEKASLIVKAMDNPVKIMIDEIRRMDEDPGQEVVLKRRSKMEVRIDILQASSMRPLRPTHIMKAANISYNDLKVIIDELERRGLISLEVTVGGKYYQSTSEGLRLLEEYKRFKDRLFD
jgi:predicted glycosyltransferase/predicted transcriptional regulator